MKYSAAIMLTDPHITNFSREKTHTPVNTEQDTPARRHARTTHIPTTIPLHACSSGVDKDCIAAVFHVPSVGVFEINFLTCSCTIFGVVHSKLSLSLCSLSLYATSALYHARARQLAFETPSRNRQRLTPTPALPPPPPPPCPRRPYPHPPVAIALN